MVPSILKYAILRFAGNDLSSRLKGARACRAFKAAPVRVPPGHARGAHQDKTDATLEGCAF